MIPSQIITGSANPSPLTFSYTKFEDEIYYAYSSGTNVQILKGASLKVIQILTGHKSDVTCISWFTQDSKLLTASGNEIYLYILNSTKRVNYIKIQQKDEIYWQKVFILKNPFEITSMSWLNSNSFIVGGNYLVKWKLNMEKIMKVYLNNNNMAVDYIGGSGSVARVKEQKMIDKQARITWTIDSSQPIHHLSCSPDGSLFATSSKFDRVIKVWYLQKRHVKKSKLDSDLEELERQQQQQLQQQQLQQQQQKGYYRDQFNKLTNRGNYVPSTQSKPDDDRDQGSTPTTAGEAFFSPIQQELISKKIKQKSQQKQKNFELESYGFIYLPHPRSISWISWRHRKTSSQNILLTNCQDGIVRFWQQSYQSRRLQFNVSNIIKSGSDIIDWVSNINDEVLLDDDSYNQPSNQDNNNNNSNNNNTNNSSSNSNSNKNSNNQNSNIKSNILNNPILLRQKNSLEKTKFIVDWIIGLKSDGSLFLWRLKTDCNNSKQTSSISIWINSQILSNQEIGPNRIIALYQPISFQDNTPSSIKICFNSFNGAISCRKFFIQHHNHTQISNSSLSSRCYGHRGPIKDLSVSSSQPFLSSMDQQQNVILWQTNDCSQIPSPFYLTDIGSFPNFSASAWSPTKKYCFFSGQEGIICYNMESNDQSVISSASAMGSTHSLSMKTLPIYVGFVKGSRLEDQDQDQFEKLLVVEPLNSIFNNAPIGDSVSEYIPYEYFLIALTKDGNRLMIWGITIRKDTQYSPSGNTSILKSRLLVQKDFERHSRLTCMCESPKGISSGLELQSEKFSVIPTQPLFIGGSVGGDLTVFGLTVTQSTLNYNNNSGKSKETMDDDMDETDVFSDTEMEIDHFHWQLTEMASYAAYQHPVESVKPAYFGRFASKALSTVNPNPEIHIWEVESHTPSLKLEDTIVLVQSFEEEEKQRQQPITITMSQQDTIQVTQHSTGIACCFSFYQSDDGNCCLAIGFGHQLKILMKPIDRTIGSYKKPWMETHSYYDLSSPCQSIQWGRDMSLYATSGNQILIFNKWIKPLAEESSPVYKQLSVGNLPTVYHQQSQLSRSLAFYHPKFLSEYMMAGKFDTIEVILNHIFKYLYDVYSPYEDDLENLPRNAIYIPPISDSVLLGIDKQSQGPKDLKSSQDDVEKMNSYKGKDKDDSDQDEQDLFRDQLTTNKFTKQKATKLNEILSTMKLGNLNANEQIQLLAVTDTYGDIGELRGGLDENGSRFVLVAKIFQFLRKSLLPQDRPISLSTNDILWALHSEAQETILQVCFSQDPDWDGLKQIGAGLWIKSPSTLKNVVEKLAKTTYLLKRDPEECALYYMALKKKGALIALHKAHKNLKQVEFLSQDFTQQKWITAAAKSAFILQSKHKYEVAASLFLLVGQVKNAVNLIIQITGDFQLALVISRLYEGENGDISRMIIEDHIIPHAKKTNDRSLLSIANWLLKKYEDAFTVLIPSTNIEGNRKLDDISREGTAGYLSANIGSTSPINVSGSSSPNIYSAGFSRSSSASSPRPSMFQMSTQNQQQPTQIAQQKAIFNQLRSSDMGPSLLYFFRFLKNHTFLRQLSDDIKKDDQFLRSSTYSYLNSGCNILALNNLLDLEKLHPKLISAKELAELKEKEKREKEEKEERERKEKEEKEKKSSSDFDFGGGSSSRFSSSNYDMGLDFGGSSSRFSSSNNNDMGLDFGGSSSRFSSSNNNDMGLDFGGSSSRFSSNNNNNDLGLDFGSSSSRFSSNNNNNDMGLDFGSTTTTKPSSSSWDFLDSTKTTSPPVITTTLVEETPKEDNTRIPNEKLSFYPLIDLELKTKSILLILVDRIIQIHSNNSNSKNISNNQIENYQELMNSIRFYSSEYNLKESIILEKLVQFCLDRQFIRESIYLTRELYQDKQQQPVMEILESCCLGIIKSISRMDDYRISTDFQQVQKQTIEIYESFRLVQFSGSQLINVTLYLLVLLLGWGAHRYDIMLTMFAMDLKPSANQKSFLSMIEKVCQLPLEYQDEEQLVDSDSDSDQDKSDPKKKALKRYTIQSCLDKIMDYLALKKFRLYFEEYLKTNNSSVVSSGSSIGVNAYLDIISQRLNYWLGTIQLKLLNIPKKVVQHYKKNPPKSTAIDNLYDYIKTFKQFSSKDQLELWNVLLYKNEHPEILDRIIYGHEIEPQHQHGHQSEIVLKGGSATGIPTSGSSSGRLKFEEEVELYKDNDLLQSFCLDTTSPDLSVLAIATTRGIREINLKQLYENYRDDYDMDSLSVTETFLSPTQTRKFRVSSKSVSTLNIGKNKNVFKSAISSLNLSKSVDHNIIVQCLESHPTKSYYLSGGIDGSVCLWQYGIPEVLTAYQLPTKPRIVKCHFNQSGTKFGACDMSGNILLWQFAAQEDTLKPFYSLQAHSKQALDFTFLNSGSLLATAGICLDSKRDVCLWDVLLPPHKSLIASYTDQENGASSIIYSPKHQSIIVGGKKGSLTMYDIRTHRATDTFKAHQLNTKTIAMDPSEEFLISGSSDGNVKVWSLPSMTCVNTFEDCHKKQTFVRPTGVFKSPVSTYGVMQVGIENNNIFSCGSDGRLLKRKITK
ncbi:WD-40 repeat-containing protein [Tieghemostelium lacteum]|uniref:WD-40 repeat-containing protein n=1 Tax=Tieghemostelium lacteum TaxID=361077 RepID=A0A152A4S5_TIELA|nr:WD-40 repeat-containing protein [Tieghemostelium lacteum]|eukprot:KYR01250.1 WD-40 repeat-containing protein [Tieghemostelium lacteum]